MAWDFSWKLSSRSFTSPENRNRAPLISRWTARLDQSMLIPHIWRAIAKRYRPSQQPTGASLSKNPGDWDPSSQNGVLLRCVSFYPLPHGPHLAAAVTTHRRTTRQ